MTDFAEVPHAPLPKEVTADQYSNAYDKIKELTEKSPEEIDLDVVRSIGSHLRTILLASGALEAATYDEYHDPATGEIIPPKTYFKRVITNEKSPPEEGFFKARLVADPHKGKVDTIQITEFGGEYVKNYEIIIPTTDETEEWPGDIATATDYRVTPTRESTMGNESRGKYVRVLKDSLTDLVPLIKKPVSVSDMPPI